MPERAALLILYPVKRGCLASHERPGHSATLIRSPTSGGRRVWQFSPKSDALAQHSTKPKQHEFLHGN